MPLAIAKRGKRFRLVEPSGSIAKNSKGTAIDGGGHSSREKAEKQRNAINMSKHTFA